MSGADEMRDAFFTSRYKAYHPDGRDEFKIVTLTAKSKRRFEEKGWRFVRTTLSDWNR